MKIALFGAGKTGSKVLECAKDSTVLGPYTRSRTPSMEELCKADCAMVFVPGEGLQSILPTLIEVGIPVISGTTGYTFTPELKKLIAEREIPWVQASNFSLGMNLAFALTRMMGEFLPARGDDSIFLSETHHVKKIDSPSGTALSLQNALGRKVRIQSLRVGDVVGEHSVELNLPGENLTLTHTVTDRKVFAEGALWAARFVMEKKLAPGFHLFEDLVREYCFERNAQ